MSCETASKNATPPEPGIAPSIDGPAPTPAAQDIDPRAAAEALLALHDGHATPATLRALVPDFDAPFFQAGLAGYSDAAMRIIARRHGCPFCVTEALLDRTLIAGGRGFAKADLGELHENVPGGAEDSPLSCQIMGSDPQEMAAAALKAVEQAARPNHDYRALAYAGKDAQFAQDIARQHLRLPGGIQVGRPDHAKEPRTQASVRRPNGQWAIGNGQWQGSPTAASLSPSPTSPSSPLPTAHCPLPPSPPPSFATIDINLACPVKKISSKARGGHWLADPDGAIAILEAVRDALPAHIPVTVKMRRSFDDTPEMAANFTRIFDAAYDIGCAWVTVHARTVQQKYVGPSRWDLLRRIVHEAHARDAKNKARGGAPRLIFGSGDIWTAADIFRMLAYTQGKAPGTRHQASAGSKPSASAASALMPDAKSLVSSSSPGLAGASVARGCIGNPWLFRQARQILAGQLPTPPSLPEQRAVLEQHLALAHAVNQAHRLRDPELHTAKTMRKFGIQFAQHHPNPTAVKAAFIRARSLEDWRTALDAHYPAPA